MKTLFASSEIFPFAKTGGLADVAQALPQALSSHIDVVCVMPLYGFMDRSHFSQASLNFNITLAGITYPIDIYTTQNQDVKTYLVDAPLLSTTQVLYSDTNDDLRFGIFCMAIVELALHVKVDLIHLNDWHTALVALFIKERALSIKTLFSIHNLAYQGIFEHTSLERLGIDNRYFTMDALEFYGSINFMKAGIAFSDAVTTVSPQYAKEILTEQFGCGLEGFLRHHADKLSGILNGIDTTHFDPQNDRALIENYSSKNIEAKYQNKKALLKETALKDPRKPLFVMISRLVGQKGFDLLLQAIKPMLKKRLNLLLLVDGESHYKEPLENIASSHENFTLLSGYDEARSRRIYSGSDFLLMPSLFEPCGLNQMIAMRYGSVPVVHSVGGLFDSVHEDDVKCGQGVVFSKPTKKDFLDAIERALKLKSNTKQMKEIINFNMQCDFSFESQIQTYIKLYKDIVLQKDYP
ncbi:MAG: glycogen synthase [Campylobacterota bacterium]|nr:glycogen synthase [Campylobacterota bacterium]